MADEADEIRRASIRILAFKMLLSELLADIYKRDTRALDDLERKCVDELTLMAADHAEKGRDTLMPIHRGVRKELEGIFEDAHRALEKRVRHEPPK